jgi:hypothetical protein
VDAPGGRPLLEWSPEERLELMDSLDIASAIVSLSTPGANLGDGANAAHVTRQADEYGAQLATDHPGWFGFSATLTPVGRQGHRRVGQALASRAVGRGVSRE